MADFRLDARLQIMVAQRGTEIEEDLSDMSNNAVPDIDLFVTPSRRRQARYIHQISSPEQVRFAAPDRLRRIPSVDTEDIRPAIENEPVRPGAESSDGPDGWIAFAACNSPRIDSIQTTWEVPGRPERDYGQTVYLFTGIETDIGRRDPKLNGRHILQPVLQWGSDADGRRGWSVASWFAGRFSQLAVRSPFTRVEEGQSLTASIASIGRAEDQGKELVIYACQFEGIEESRLIVRMPPAFRAVEALEAYDIEEDQEQVSYPGGDIRMQDINVNGNGQRVRWTLTNRAANDLHLDIDMNADNTGGTVHMEWRQRQPQRTAAAT